MFASGEYPRLVEDITTLIVKTGGLKNGPSYRGITLINVLAQVHVYSQLLSNKPTYWTEMYNKITKRQFGFQKRKSIIECIFILLSVVVKCLVKVKKLYRIFINYEKSFDKIDRAF